ncbi:MAG: hypothetical protein P4L36_20785 [Holophaga sp.]|nr:hypothetical protein [Holophaga sp.]
MLVLGTTARAEALSYGPFSLNAFAKIEDGRYSNQANNIQVSPSGTKQENWGDNLVAGAPLKTEPTHVWLFQPWLGAKFDIGGGFKLSGMVSQRWRGGDGDPTTADIPGFIYEENVAISHEDYGRLAVGKMVARGWSVADYPYGTNVGLADEWAQSGAGYGLLTKAVRYTSRTFDVLKGDLVLEATYDEGNTAFKTHKPRFFEFYGQYHNAGLVVDVIGQATRNGNPQAWGQGPFTGLTPFSRDDSVVGGAGQGILMIMARYDYDKHWQYSGGIRFNQWSGAHAVITVAGPPAQWNDMFNVNWNGTSNGVSNPGYSASETDGFGAVLHRWGPWSTWLAAEILGKATTANPSERGQNNWANFDVAGVQYDFGHGLVCYGEVGLVHYGKLGPSPMSMSTNSAFTGVDSRVSRNGNWILIGVLYVL